MKRFVYWIGLSFMAACGTTITAMPTNRPVRPMAPRDAMSVEVYTTGNPQRPYVEVAYLEAQQESELSVDRAPRVLDKMRQEAAAMGCDALVLGGPNDAVVGSSWRGTGGTHTLRGYRGTCIQWTEGPQVAGSATVPMAGEPPPGSPAPENE